jgi:WD40 repeat protein
MMDLDALNSVEVVQTRLPISCLEVSPQNDELAIGCSTGAILFQPLHPLQQNQLPFLITRPRSSEEHTRLKARREKIVRDARLALASHRFADAYNLAGRGLEIAGGDADAEDEFRDVLLNLPTRRVELREWRLRWSSLNVYGSMTAIRAGPTVNGMACGSGRNVLVVGTDQGLHRLRATDGADIEKLEIPQIRAISYDDTNNSCVAAMESGKVALMYFGSLGQIVQSPERGAFSSIVRLSGSIRGIAACGSANGTVVFWHGHDVFEWLHVMPSPIEALAISPDSTWLAVAGHDGIVGCLDISALRSLGALENNRGAIRALAFDPTGQWLASAGDDGGVHVWNVRSASLLGVYQGHQNRVHALAFSPDGDWLASGDADGEIRISRIADSTQTVLRVHREEISVLTFDLLGGSLYCGYRFGGICRWDLHWSLDLSSSEIYRIQEHARVVAAAATLAPRPEMKP